MTLTPLAAKAAFAVPLAALSNVLGVGGYPVIFFIVVALIDWITGTMKALKKRQLGKCRRPRGPLAQNGGIYFPFGGGGLGHPYLLHIRQSTCAGYKL